MWGKSGGHKHTIAPPPQIKIMGAFTHTHTHTHTHYTCMPCGTSHLQTVQENILSDIILATYRKFTVTTVRFTQNASCNIYTHPRYQQVANVTV